MAGAFGVLATEAEEDCEENKTKPNESTEGYADFGTNGQA